MHLSQKRVPRESNRERVEAILKPQVDENNNTIDTVQLDPAQKTTQQNNPKPWEKKPKKYIVLPYSNRKADKFAQNLK